jgi:hypothetical protein
MRTVSVKYRPTNASRIGEIAWIHAGQSTPFSGSGGGVSSTRASTLYGS